MKKSIKKEWVDALRSGEYKQTKGVLKDKDSFCCLGVLCDIHSKETGEEWEEDTYFVEVGELPERVVSWAELTGFNPSNPLVKVNDITKRISLAELNDGGKIFDEIADIIEENL